MREPEHAQSIVSAMVKAVKIPVTVKMRAGWTDVEIGVDLFGRERYLFARRSERP